MTPAEQRALTAAAALLDPETPASRTRFSARFERTLLADLQAANPLPDIIPGYIQLSMILDIVVAHLERRLSMPEVDSGIPLTLELGVPVRSPVPPTRHHSFDMPPQLVRRIKVVASASSTRIEALICSLFHAALEAPDAVGYRGLPVDLTKARALGLEKPLAKPRRRRSNAGVAAGATSPQPPQPPAAPEAKKGRRKAAPKAAAAKRPERKYSPRLKS